MKPILRSLQLQILLLFNLEIPSIIDPTLDIVNNHSNWWESSTKNQPKFVPRIYVNVGEGTSKFIAPSDLISRNGLVSDLDLGTLGELQIEYSIKHFCIQVYVNEHHTLITTIHIVFSVNYYLKLCIVISKFYLIFGQQRSNWFDWTL